MFSFGSSATNVAATRGVYNTPAIRLGPSWAVAALLLVRQDDCVNVRPAQPSDWDKLAELRAALWPESPVADHAAELRRVLAGEPLSTLPSAIFVAEDSKRVLQGFLEAGLRSHADGSVPLRRLRGRLVCQRRLPPQRDRRGAASCRGRLGAQPGLPGNGLRHTANEHALAARSRIARLPRCRARRPVSQATVTARHPAPSRQRLTYIMLFACDGLEMNHKPGRNPRKVLPAAVKARVHKINLN